jgi:hypothetical protein
MIEMVYETAREYQIWCGCHPECTARFEARLEGYGALLNFMTELVFEAKRRGWTVSNGVFLAPGHSVKDEVPDVL